MASRPLAGFSNAPHHADYHAPWAKSWIANDWGEAIEIYLDDHSYE
jgi:hypothetical protein